MDSRQDFQPFLPKANGKLPHLSNQYYRDKPEENEEERLDLSWLFGVVRRRFAVMAVATLVMSTLTGGMIYVASKNTILEYAGSFSLLVEPATAEGLLSKQLSKTTEADISRINIEGISLVDYETQIRILRSPKMMEPILKDLQKKGYPKLTYNELMSKLSINRVSYEKDGKQAGTKILQVHFKDKNIKKIYEVLTVVSKAYLEYSLQQRLTGINQAIKFIESELPKLRERVALFQLQLQGLRQERNLFEPQLEGKSLSEQVQSLRNQRIALQVQLTGMRNLYNSYQRLLEQNNPAGILLTQGQAYGGLLGQIQRVDAELSLKLAQYQEDSLPVQALRKSRQELVATATRVAREVVIGTIASQIQEVEARDQAMALAQQQLEQKVRNFSVTAREYSDLQREFEVVNKSLSDFLAKREALLIDKAQQQIPWVMINPPQVPMDRYNRFIPSTVKQTRKQLALAFILSGLLGIAIGLLVEVLNTVFHNPEEIRTATKRPVLGVIPLSKRPRSRPMRRSKKSAAAGDLADSNAGERPKVQSEMDYPFLEAFRSLYTNIYLMSSGRSIRSLLVASAVAGDGKTTVAVHLAQTAAAVGQRVLLVDGDLRCPQLHLRLGLPNVRGLSDAISTDLSLNDAIQRSPTEENLFVLTAGHIPPDPIKLLSSKKMLYLMEQFQAFFDLVIYDTPPLMGLADGHLIAAHTDGTVMVVQIAQTDRSQVRKALDELKISGANVFGIVANGSKSSKHSTSQRQITLDPLYATKLQPLSNKNPQT